MVRQWVSRDVDGGCKVEESQRVSEFATLPHVVVIPTGLAGW